MKKKIACLLIMAVSFLFASGSFLIAAPPMDWKKLKNKHSDFKPCGTMGPERIQKLQALGAIRSQTQKTIKSPEEKHVIVLRVQFSGGPTMLKSLADTEAFFDDMKDYYYENSYGILTTSVTVTRSTYTLLSVDNYNDETSADLIRLWNDSVAAATAGIDFTQYDYVMIYHAGYGEEESGNLADLWSLFLDGNFTADAKTFDGFTVVPEKCIDIGKSPLGVICHEFGHQLGLVDLYDISENGGRSTCGSWSLMDYPYGFDNSGKNPPHLDPWSKNYLRYIDISSRTVSTDLSNASLGDIETSQTTGYYKIPVEGGTSLEYFIVEYRRADAAKIKYDLNLPTTGLLIWHIDDTIALDPVRFANNTINSGGTYPAVDLVEADGQESYPPGKAGDVFRDGSSFSTPQSDSFSGVQSGIAIASIFTFNGQISFSISKIAAASVALIAKIINYPNPAGNGYSHPRSGSGVVTTIVFHSPRPPNDVKLTIYNIAGEKVAFANKESFKLNLGTDGPSSDYKWVYEYDWNAKNSSGNDVAPGIYFYRLNADENVKVGKLAIVR